MMQRGCGIGPSIVHMNVYNKPAMGKSNAWSSRQPSRVITTAAHFSETSPATRKRFCVFTSCHCSNEISRCTPPDVAIRSTWPKQKRASRYPQLSTINVNASEVSIATFLHNSLTSFSNPDINECESDMQPWRHGSRFIRRLQCTNH